MDRIRTFYNITKENDRKFVVDIANVAYLKQLSKDLQLGIPNFDDENIVIFKPEKASWKKYQKEFFDEPNIVTAADIAKNQDKMLCTFSFWDFSALIDIKPQSDSFTYIYHQNPLMMKENRIKKRVDTWLNHYGWE